MNREVHVRFCESAGLKCPAPLTFVEGRLQTREREKNGQSNRRTEIVAGRVQFLDAPSSGQGEAGATDACVDSAPETLNAASLLRGVDR